MKIVLATSIYPPDIGGPAVYAEKLKQGLEEQGIEVEVCSYQGLKKYPQPFRFLFYYFHLLRKAKGADIIYAFNLISCGFPSLKAAKFLRKKLVIRLGGDFLWERAVEKGRTKKPLREYYGEPKSFGEKFWMLVIREVLKRTDRIVFTTNLQKQIYQQHFALSGEKTAVIPNPFPEIDIPPSNLFPRLYTLLYAGRLLKLKNLETLIDVFADVLKQTNKPLNLKIIGQGPEEKKLRIQSEELKIKDSVIFEKPLSHQALLGEIQKSYLCVLPSLTEISPNFALECIKLGKPILLTKETGIYDDFKDDLIFVDPQNQEDIGNKIVALLDGKNYQEYLNKISQIQTDWHWPEVIKKHIQLLSAYSQHSH